MQARFVRDDRGRMVCSDCIVPVERDDRHREWYCPHCGHVEALEPDLLSPEEEPTGLGPESAHPHPMAQILARRRADQEILQSVHDRNVPLPADLQKMILDIIADQPKREPYSRRKRRKAIERMEAVFGPLDLQGEARAEAKALLRRRIRNIRWPNLDALAAACIFVACERTGQRVERSALVRELELKEEAWLWSVVPSVRFLDLLDIQDSASEEKINDRLAYLVNMDETSQWRQELKGIVEARFPVETYVPAVAKRLELPLDLEKRMVDGALAVIGAAQTQILKAETNPRAFAGAALYVAHEKGGNGMTQGQFAFRCGIPLRTLQRFIALLK